MIMVFEKVKEILVEELGVEAEEVSMESNIKDDLDADSLDVVQVVMAVEEAFEIEVEEEVAEKMLTVGDIVRYVEANK
ncbi:MAG: acyl carrier protein [Peptostreptococcaceae bacterium]|nr:acyl carrier protein [Peptostreptococcaceae bacterium]